MNDKIKELSEIADGLSLTEFNDISLRKFRLYREIYDEKFAELIINECLYQCNIHEAGNTNFNRYFNEGHSLGVAKCYYKIKKHFGVE